MDLPVESPPHSRLLLAAAVFCWGVLLLAVLLLPYHLPAQNPGDALTRYTVRLALLYYGLAAALMTRLRPDEWLARAGRGALARCCWTLAWAAYLVHLGMAFHHYHRWSHDAAVRHVQDVAGFGPGIYVSHVFTLVWTLDVLYWWLRPQGYARRSPWIDRLLHGFLAFVIFNGTVVYESGFIRWAGLVLLAGLAGLLLTRRRAVRMMACQG
jgi:hypothetical protein